MTKGQKRALVHSLLVAVAGAVSDMAVQLQNPAVSWTRVALIGVGLGVFSRLLGAFLAWEATLPEDAE